VDGHKVDLAAEAKALTEYWSQHVVGAANGNLFKVAKGIGETRWHQHDDQDETFVVLDGHLTVQLRDQDVELNAGDLFVIPAGVEHCPRALDDVLLLLIGPAITSTAAGGKPEWSFAGPG
jgi:quercetin dioxygenase-like cupin family protein